MPVTSIRKTSGKVLAVLAVLVLTWSYHSVYADDVTRDLSNEQQADVLWADQRQAYLEWAELKHDRTGDLSTQAKQDPIGYEEYTSVRLASAMPDLLLATLLPPGATPVEDVEDQFLDSDASGPSPANVDGPSAEAQANNPLASITAINIQNYYIGELTDSDEDANQFVLRLAQPFDIGDSSWLVRASFPLNTFPVPPDSDKETGLGDINVFAAYLFDTGNPAVSFGLGPQVTAPTATEEFLGSEQTALGVANVLFDARSPKFQWGYLATWQQRIAGDASRGEVNVFAFQPFGFYQLVDGWYLRSAPIWQFNLDNGYYSMPMGVGVGKVIKTERGVFNFFVEPQFSVADEGPGQPEWQIYFALNMQFPR